MKKKILPFILFFILLLLSCFVHGQKYLNQLDSKADFDNLAGLPLVEKYGQVSALKLVYDLRTKKSYYINSKSFRYHHEFCAYKLGSEASLDSFNQINYSNDPRKKYLLGNINYYKSLGIYALEISPADVMSSQHLNLLWNAVSKSTFIGDNLHTLLNSVRLQNLDISLEHKIPILNPSDIYKNLNYQAISKYKSSGILRFIDDLEAEKAKINPTDIIVINETPLVLPKVAGIIVNEFQTPLSHLTILGKNRKIPISAHKLAFIDTTLLKLNNKKVSYEVLSNVFKIALVDKIKTTNTKQKGVKLKFNLEVDTLIGLEFLKKKSFKYVGHKANNLGVLLKLSKKFNFKIPEGGFAIPFYFYNQHVQNFEIKQRIDNLVNETNKIHNTDSLKVILKNIRKSIKSAPIDSVLLNSIKEKVKGNGGWTRMRFRSSTNAEDAKGFSGAGLYTSKTGILNHEKKSFERAIKKVWASLWSYEAYSERAYYNINHTDAYMGILVHRSFPKEEVNGVAITKNLYRPNNYGFVVNAQVGEESVVKPKPGVVSDQFICYPNNENNIYKDKITIDIITYSSLNNNKLVMTETEIQNLANKLELIKMHYNGVNFFSESYFNFGLDIEFKLEEKNRDLYIKQVRLFND